MARKRSRKSIVSSLDMLTRQLVIKRDKSQCQWCGKKVQGKDAQCSHVRSRKYYATRWDLNNVKLLCAACHFRWHDDPTAGGLWFASAYPERLALIDEARRRPVVTYRDSDLMDIEDTLKELLNES